MRSDLKRRTVNFPAGPVKKISEGGTVLFEIPAGAYGPALLRISNLGSNTSSDYNVIVQYGDIAEQEIGSGKYLERLKAGDDLLIENPPEGKVKVAITNNVLITDADNLIVAYAFFSDKGC